MGYTKQLMEILHRDNYDDRAAPLGKRHRDIAASALEGMGYRTKDSKIIRYTLQKLPPYEVF